MSNEEVYDGFSDEIVDEISDETGASAEMQKPEKVQEAGAHDEEGGVTIDVDLDHNFEWEVETEPAPAPDAGQYRYREDPRAGAARYCNKHIFTWVCSYLFGMFGVDRFMRGQIALGIIKLGTFGGLGFWYLADLVIAVVKSYAGEYRNSEDLLFDKRGRYIEPHRAYRQR